MEDVYQRLAQHMEHLVMGFPFRQPLVDLIKECYTPLEAEAALAIPAGLAPLETAPEGQVAAASGLPMDEAVQALRALADRGMIYSARRPDGSIGYALLQVGYGIPQTFFWQGSMDQRARKMARLVLGYFDVDTTRRIYGDRPTKTFRYSPASLSVEVPMQGVFSNEMMEPVLAGAGKIAVAHCACRVAARALGRTDCTHSLEVCLKYDELAQFVVDRGLARAISADEAHAILANAELEGLVHMVDNVQEQVKHTCSCCGHYCWNVGIIARRKVPRDVLMACYHIRRTEDEACLGCGQCVERCPVNALSLVDEVAVADEQWCIGCGVCALDCPGEAISLVRRTPERPPKDFGLLVSRVRAEKAANKEEQG